MKHLRLIFVVMMGALVSACASVETPSRNAPLVDVPLAAPQAVPLKVEDVVVRVPRSLKVSEANRYYPSGDIVWRGEPLGDRHMQVARVMDEGLRRGVADMTEGYPVVLDIEVARFHALTEKARYTIGGVHAIKFKLTILDAETGEVLIPTRMVEADLEAFGGQRAIAAERNGITQKVRITGHLAEVIKTEMTSEEGFKHANHGVMGLINQL